MIPRWNSYEDLMKLFFQHDVSHVLLWGYRSASTAAQYGATNLIFRDYRAIQKALSWFHQAFFTLL
jgi:hypothetical protein